MKLGLKQTNGGRYQLEQEALWRRAAPLRRRLIEAYAAFIAHARASRLRGDAELASTAPKSAGAFRST